MFMKTSEYIVYKISKLPKGYVFTYREFIVEETKQEAVIKYLNRMVASGKIEKLSKGKYYKPQNTVFGNLLPEQYQIVKDLIEKDGKTVGYITGLSYFNAIGLTTQVGNIIQIAKNETRPALQRGRFKITFIKQKNIVNKQNIPWLRILDSIRFIKKIPDANINTSCKVIINLIADLAIDEQEQLLKLALKYPPSTRALLGAILEKINNGLDLQKMKASLNPITVYKYGISEAILSTMKNWNIQ